MPDPVSVTRSATKSPSMPAAVSFRDRVTFSAVMVIKPPFGMASRALTTRLTRASSSSLASTFTSQIVLSIADVSFTVPPMELVNIICDASRVSRSDSAVGLCGWRREKVSN